MYLSNERLQELKSKSNMTKEIGITSKNNTRFLVTRSKGSDIIIDQEKQFYYDVKNNKCGDIMDFLMKEKNYSFQKAIKRVAGFDIQLEKGNRKDRRLMYHVNALAAAYYHKKLWQSPEALTYMRERKILYRTAKEFQIGFCDGKGLLIYMKKLGISKELLMTCGLLNDKGRERFFNRLIFPILDYNGNVTGFGGRAIKKNKIKYLNSSDSPVFDKSISLYGINIAKKSNKSDLIITEGFMDTISLHQAGFRNAVASMGTALTKEQVGIISLLYKRVYLSQDSDEAGIMAKTKSAKLLMQHGIDVRIVGTKPYKDPDELIKACGREEYQKRLQIAKPFKTFILENPIGNTSVEKHEFMAKMLVEQF